MNSIHAQKLVRKRQVLIDRIRSLGPVLRGSVSEVRLTCGKRSCRCQKGQRHRAFYVSYRFQGKTKVVHLPAMHVPEAQRLRQNWGRLKGLLEELADLQITLWKEVSDEAETTYQAKTRGRKANQGDKTATAREASTSNRPRASGQVEDETHEPDTRRRNSQGSSRRA